MNYEIAKERLESVTFGCGQMSVKDILDNLIYIMKLKEEILSYLLYNLMV
jgi:hypothetical protein